jgi:hypothetical protein
LTRFPQAGAFLTSNMDANLGPQLPSILNGLGADGWEVVGIADIAFSKRSEIILKKQWIELSDGRCGRWQDPRGRHTNEMNC